MFSLSLSVSLCVCVRVCVCVCVRVCTLHSNPVISDLQLFCSSTLLRVGGVPMYGKPDLMREEDLNRVRRIIYYANTHCRILN